jgi:hypothetical protein
MPARAQAMIPTSNQSACGAAVTAGWVALQLLQFLLSTTPRTRVLPVHHTGRSRQLEFPGEISLGAIRTSAAYCGINEWSRQVKETLKVSSGEKIFSRLSCHRTEFRVAQ